MNPNLIRKRVLVNRGGRYSYETRWVRPGMDLRSSALPQTVYYHLHWRGLPLFSLENARAEHGYLSFSNAADLVAYWRQHGEVADVEPVAMFTGKVLRQKADGAYSVLPDARALVRWVTWGMIVQGVQGSGNEAG